MNINNYIEFDIMNTVSRGTIGEDFRMRRRGLK
jgi:hypothetical protein